MAEGLVGPIRPGYPTLLMSGFAVVLSDVYPDGTVTIMFQNTTLARATVANVRQGARALVGMAWPTDLRPDGFPLCPVCGEDEVYTSDEGFVVGCYKCSWRPPDPRYNVAPRVKEKQ